MWHKYNLFMYNIIAWWTGFCIQILASIGFFLCLFLFFSFFVLVVLRFIKLNEIFGEGIWVYNVLCLSKMKQYICEYSYLPRTPKYKTKFIKGLRAQLFSIKMSPHSASSQQDLTKKWILFGAGKGPIISRFYMHFLISISYNYFKHVKAAVVILSGNSPCLKKFYLSFLPSSLGFLLRVKMYIEGWG